MILARGTLPSAEFKSHLLPSSQSLPIDHPLARPWHIAIQNYCRSSRATRNVTPTQQSYSRDGRFYRVAIEPSAHVLAQVCPRPERKHEARLALKKMEEQASGMAPFPHYTIAKWKLEALASIHFTYLRCPVPSRTALFTGQVWPGL